MFPLGGEPDLTWFEWKLKQLEAVNYRCFWSHVGGNGLFVA